MSGTISPRISGHFCHFVIRLAYFIIALIKLNVDYYNKFLILFRTGFFVDVLNLQRPVEKNSVVQGFGIAFLLFVVAVLLHCTS